jgi:hypothetical protein
MAQFMRHVGRTANTDRRIVVVFMQIPGREDHALVVDTDALPQKYHDDLMAVVEGEGQGTVDLGDILGRRKMTYTGHDIMSSLHQAGVLQAMPISNIIMLPQPNRGIPLADILKHKAASESGTKPVVDESVYASNHHLDNQSADKNDKQYQLAKNFIIEAEMLEADAKMKREKAYQIYPNLRPQLKTPVVSESVSEEVKPEALEKPKRTRRKENAA